MKTRLAVIATACWLLWPAVPVEAGWRYSAAPPAQVAPQPIPGEPRSEAPARPALAAGELPRRGSTQDRVLRELGEPELRVPAVGRPPIIRWSYPAFIVYFERDRVITSVAR